MWMDGEGMKIADNFGFYGILTNPVRGYEYCTELMIDYEIRFVQLRMKKSSPQEVKPVAEKMTALTRGTKTLCVVNDFVDIAREVGADGVHVGQDDMAFDEVQKIVGGTTVIGLSTHSPDQTREACKKGPSYIGVGPVYPTPTKENPDPVIGFDGMKAMLEIATVPAVCLGGISLERLPYVLEAGAKNVSLVREICQSDNPAKVLKKIIKTWESFQK